MAFLLIKIIEDNLGRIYDLFGFRRYELSFETMNKSLNSDIQLMTERQEHITQGLTILLKDLENNNNVSSHGRYMIINEIKGYLISKSKVYKAIDIEPSLAETKIFRPVFILSLPRTGSTFLHCLLSQDSRWKAPAYWEILQQIPVITDPLMEEHKNIIKTFNRNTNFLKDIWGREDIENSHLMDITDPEDVATLLAAEGLHFLLNDIFELPNYKRYLSNLPYDTWVKIYKNMKLRLQVLSRYQNMENRRLMLMFHLGSYNNKLALLDVFPDAQFIFLHRDLSKIIPSVASLFSYIARQYYPRNKEDVQLICNNLTKRYIRETETIDDWLNHEKFQNTSFKRVHHISFKELVDFPLDTVKAIYNAVDMTYTNECEALFKTYIDEQKQHKRNKHKYRNMNIDKEEIEDKTREYCNKYSIQKGL
ncbi:unnamed protein product [Dimorphilus gyrociliatus]|uniref:Uncharacterized protein n=1 Tax=Dimorphilus gyrociliatus TaxID=2664684 RepID=A0A7I8V8B7_9ANNE|nr:unnamed protein product [Dimorphilus gyrociliatus]